MGLWRLGGRVDRWVVGFAVRRVWPDGSHEFIRFTPAMWDAARFMARDRRLWRWGPVRPASWTVVSMSRNDFELHRRRLLCRSPDCPDTPPQRPRAENRDQPEGMEAHACAYPPSRAVARDRPGPHRGTRRGPHRGGRPSRRPPPSRGR